MEFSVEELKKDSLISDMIDYIGDNLLAIFVGGSFIRNLDIHTEQSDIDLILLTADNFNNEKYKGKYTTTLDGIHTDISIIFFPTFCYNARKFIHSARYSSFISNTFLSEDDFIWINEKYKNKLLKYFVNNAEYKRNSLLVGTYWLYNNLMWNKSVIENEDMVRFDYVMNKDYLNTDWFITYVNGVKANNCKKFYHLYVATRVLKNEIIDINFIKEIKEQLIMNKVTKDNWLIIKNDINWLTQYFRETNITDDFTINIYNEKIYSYLNNNVLNIN